MVKIYSLNSAQAFIVEHSTDKNIIQKLTKKNVFTTHGSGLDPSCFSKTTKGKNNKNYRFGYMSRFHRSKGTNEIIKIAQQLSPEKELIVAGADVRGNKFSKKFNDLALEKNNIKFLGKLKTREKVSEFFQLY